MSLEFWSGLQRICRVLWERDILTLLILLIHEHEISFHSFLSFSIYFINTLYFSVYISFFSLVKSHRFLEGLTARCSGLSDQVQALLSGSSDLLLAPPRLLKCQLPSASPAPQVTATREGNARPPASWCPHGTFRTLARLTSYFWNSSTRQTVGGPAWVLASWDGRFNPLSFMLLFLRRRTLMSNVSGLWLSGEHVRGGEHRSKGLKASLLWC